ncbi:uncharacterized protein LOC113755388 [Coffea eugenioides]|uniref:Protein NYNRIN-like n=1 Tax=Coffea arabica TaxID=13443 RepID=A0A6P6SKS6_COFAR|nr:uncharacterized protein LOC113692514 [Coffea arabica]XP_027155197.1 uncharacterized protein LOC113755388 [Coffea eugenioides]
MSSRFFLNGEVLYKKTFDLGLLRCIDEEEANYMINEVHSRVCGPDMNGHLLAKKIMRSGYFWLTMEHDCIDFIRKCVKCQMHSDVIRAPPTELYSKTTSWPCSICGMDVIGAIDPPASNGPQMNGVVEAANKNLKKIIRKMTEAHRNWHEKLPYALMAYRTTIRTSTGVTPYSLMYGMEAVLTAEVEIPSLHILMEAQIEDAEWVRERYEQLSLIDEKRLNAVCHGQCYQQRMARIYNKKVKPCLFEVGEKVLKRILPMQEEAKGKFPPNWQGPFTVKKVLSREALILMEMDGQEKLCDTILV